MTKPTKWPLHPAKTQISLGIRSVWSGSLLSAWRNTGSSPTHWAHCEDPDQTGQMPRLIRPGHPPRPTDCFAGYVMRRFNCSRMKNRHKTLQRRQCQKGETCLLKKKLQQKSPHTSVPSALKTSYVLFIVLTISSCSCLRRFWMLERCRSCSSSNSRFS